MSTVYIRPRDRDDEPRPDDCNPIKKPCDNIWIGDKPAPEKQNELLSKCCKKDMVCKDDTSGELGAGGFTNLIVNAYIKNSKLVEGNTQKTCAGRKEKKCGDLSQFELLIDLSPSQDPQEKQKEGDKIKRGCGSLGKVGKPNERIKTPGTFPMRVPINVIPGWDGQEGVDCPIIVPLLNVKIPNKKKCIPEDINTLFNIFLRDCNNSIDPGVGIPNVCGGEALPQCNWTHFYQPDVAKPANNHPAKSFYNAQGFLKDIYIKKDKINCKFFAKDLLSPGGQGPKNTAGVPLLDQECAQAFGIKGINPSKPTEFASINCPSDDFLETCGLFQCLDDGANNEDNVGVDDDNNVIDINSSNITVSIVSKGQNTIASECLNGEIPKAYQYSSGSDIYIDIHIGSDCEEENIDANYKGVVICQLTRPNCDDLTEDAYYQDYCRVNTWQGKPPTNDDPNQCNGELCCGVGEGGGDYAIKKIFDCVDEDSDVVKNYLKGPNCTKDPTVYCCVEDASNTIRNRLLDIPISRCCLFNGDIMRDEDGNPTNDLARAQRICKPKVACCMAAPESPEGTCYYASPNQIVSQAVFTYFYRGNISTLEPLINIYRDWDDPNVYSEQFKDGSWTQLEAALKKIKVSASKAAKNLVKLPMTRGGAPDINNYSKDDFKKVWEEGVKFAVKNGTLKVISKPYNFSITKTYDVDECSEENVKLYEYQDVGLTIEDVKAKIGDFDIIDATESNAANALGINLPATPTTFVPDIDYNIEFKKCLTTEWSLQKARTRDYFKCQQMYKKISSCCQGGSFVFVPDLVSQDLTTSEVQVKCVIDTKTGQITCTGLPPVNNGELCFIISDDDNWKASYLCESILHRKGKVIATENEDLTLDKCPEGITCAELPNPPDPQPVPDPEDADNPLDPPTVPDTDIPPPTQNPKEPTPKDDRPLPPPKRKPQQSPQEVDCNNKREELKKLRALRTQYSGIIIPQLQAKLSAPASNFANNVTIWNNECSGIAYALESWFGDDKILKTYCQRIMENICLNWNGVDSLPSNFPSVGTVMPFGKVQANPTIVNIFAALQEANTTLSSTQDQINELQTYVIENCLN